MDQPYLLHLITANPHLSPFDVSLACQAGWQVVVPYTSVTLDQVGSLACEAAAGAAAAPRRSAILLGGSDIALAFDMMDAARRAMPRGAEIGILADPSGAFSTAAALVASIESQLLARFAASLTGRQLVLLGRSGPLAAATAVLAAGTGARVHSAPTVADLPQDTEILVALPGARAGGAAAAPAQACPALKLAVDLNPSASAVLAGIGAGDCGVPLEGGPPAALGIGALFIANVRQKVARAQLDRLRVSDTAQALDFRDAFDYARCLLGRPALPGSPAPAAAAPARPAAV